MSGGKHQITLTPENWECLHDLAQKFEPKTSVSALANDAVRRGFQSLNFQLSENKRLSDLMDKAFAPKKLTK